MTVRDFLNAVLYSATVVIGLIVIDFLFDMLFVGEFKIRYPIVLGALFLFGIGAHLWHNTKREK